MFPLEAKPTRTLRWSIGLLLALAMHTAAALPFILPAPVEETAEDDYSGAVLVELEPLAVASADSTSTMATAETAASEASDAQVHAEAVPQKSSDAPVIPQSDYTPPEQDLRMAVARPVESKQETETDRAMPTEEKVAPTSAPSAQSAAEAAQAPTIEAESKATHAVAETQGISDKALKKLVENWQKEIVTSIAKHRAYPPEARARGTEGTVMVRFSIDRYGRLITKTMTQSSGHDLLDKAAVATLERVPDFPAAPKALAGEAFEFALPIKFSVIKQ